MDKGGIVQMAKLVAFYSRADEIIWRFYEIYSDWQY